MPTALFAGLSLFVVFGCGQDQKADTESGPGGQTDAPDRAAILSEAGIDVHSALGLVELTIAEPGPCPFLSDETAVSGVTTEFEFLRKSVSNSECIWNYNIGFEINVRIAPLTDATARADRVYNLENPPVLEAQSGPGSDAQLFLDPTWDPANPRPYAFAFSLGDQEIMVSTVGTKTSPEQLRRVADEIAAKLPTAPSIEPQRRQATNAFDPCTYWQSSELIAAFGLEQNTSSFESPFGKSACTYNFTAPDGVLLEVRAGLFECDDDYISKRKENGFQDLSTISVPALRKTETNSWGQDFYLEAKKDGYCINVMSLKNRDPVLTSLESGMEQLLENLILRTPETL